MLEKCILEKCILEKCLLDTIGYQVKKSSNKPFKPFKSGNKVNTVKGIVRNPQTNRYAFIFDEDTSNVECWKCELVE